jgi:hypothetical protein
MTVGIYGAGWVESLERKLVLRNERDFRANHDPQASSLRHSGLATCATADCSARYTWMGRISMGRPF